jgi:hypothetical protein
LAIAGVVFCGGVATWLWGSDGADRVTEEDRARHEASFKSVTTYYPRWATVLDVDEALASMPLSPGEKEELRQRLRMDLRDKRPGDPQHPLAYGPSYSRLELARFRVWDTHQSDGDVIAIQSAGYRITVTIRNQIQEVIVPVQGGRPVTVTGIHDGGGGITLGFDSHIQPMLAPIMSEGQVITVPLS